MTVVLARHSVASLQTKNNSEGINLPGYGLCRCSTSWRAARVRNQTRALLASPYASDVDGMSFHTACSTAFVQPALGKPDSPGPMKVRDDQLRRLLGITDVNYVQGKHALAVVDSTLA